MLLTEPTKGIYRNLHCRTERKINKKKQAKRYFSYEVTLLVNTFPLWYPSSSSWLINCFLPLAPRPSIQAAATKYPRLGGLRQQKLIAHSFDWVSEIRRQPGWMSHRLLVTPSTADGAQESPWTPSQEHWPILEGSACRTSSFPKSLPSKAITLGCRIPTSELVRTQTLRS